MTLLDSRRPLDALRREITVRRVERRPPLTPAEIIERVGEATGVTSQRILSRNRSARVVRARWAAMHLARRSGASVREIAEAFNRCPNLVWHALRKSREKDTTI